MAGSKAPVPLLVIPALLVAALLFGCGNGAGEGPVDAVERARAKIRELEADIEKYRGKRVDFTVAYKYREKKTDRMKGQEEGYKKMIATFVAQLGATPAPALVAVGEYKFTLDQAKRKIVQLHREMERVAKKRSRVEERKDFYKKAAGQLGANIDRMQTAVAVLNEKIDEIVMLREEMEVRKELKEVNEAMAGMGEGQLGKLVREIEDVIDRTSAEIEAAGPAVEEDFPSAQEIVASSFDDPGGGQTVDDIMKEYGLK